MSDVLFIALSCTHFSVVLSSCICIWHSHCSVETSSSRVEASCSRVAPPSPRKSVLFDLAHDSPLCLFDAESVEVFVPAIRINSSYHWFSIANNTDDAEAFFSEDVIDRDVTDKQCVILVGSNFTAEDCASQFRFICQRGKVGCV